MRRSKSKFNANQRREFQPRIEACEPRDMMSANSTADFFLQADALAPFGDQLLTAHGSGAHNLTGLTQVRSTYGLTGVGQTVAVIDSGIAYDHAALGGGYGSGYRVVGGWDFTEENDANPYDDGPAGSHGTHVAGIIGGSDSRYIGLAPEVDLVGLRVFNDAGEGYFSWVEKALRWVHDNRFKYRNAITTVNISIGTDWNSTSLPNWTTLEDEFAQLEADGIFIAVSAGNSFSTYNAAGLSYPAASSHVVPVASVDDNGSLSYFSQRQARVIAAPGRSMMSTVPDYVGDLDGQTDDFVSYSGTSMAAPYVAGASVLLRQAMQLVGVGTINQSAIYNVMYDTADLVWDAQTNQSYHRLNLQRALDSIMPADDFGSTAAAAHNLGSVYDTAQVSGMLSRLDDRDYFRFTAGSTGTITLKASATDTAHARWEQTAGGAVTGDTLTLQVTAGQTYTVALAGAGLGHYDVTLDLDAPIAAVDWGTVDFRQVLGHNLAAENTFTLRASHDGYLTVLARFAAGGGNVDLQLYNSQGQLLTTGRGANGVTRIDVVARAGESFVLRGVGGNTAVDLSLVNLVSWNGSTLDVAGSGETDDIVYRAGDTVHLVVNEIGYLFDGSKVRVVNFRGQTDDAVSITGTSGVDVATFRPGALDLIGAGYEVHAAAGSIAVDGGGGADRVLFHDSAGNDTFYATPRYARMWGDGFDNTALGFVDATAFATQGSDRARLWDSAYDDTFDANPLWARLSGSGFSLRVERFDFVIADASSGADRANLFDSTGNDNLWANSTTARLSGAGFNNRAQGFEQVYATASGGYDLAALYDSAGDDLFDLGLGWARMSGAAYANRIAGFDSISGYASTGSDKVNLFDSALDDTLEGAGNWLRLSNADLISLATGFDRAKATSNRGGYDVKRLAAISFLFEQSGNWR